MHLRFIFSDESSASLDVEPSSTVAAVTAELLTAAGKQGVAAHWLFLGAPVSPSLLICDTPLVDGCTVNVFLRVGGEGERPFPQVPGDYSSKTDQFLLRTLFIASFIVFAGASFARTKYPESFTVFSNVALNIFWSLWALALAANWRSIGT